MYCVCVFRRVCKSLSVFVCMRRKRMKEAPLSCCAALIIAFQCWINIQHSALGGLSESTSICVIWIPITMSLIPRDWTASDVFSSDQHAAASIKCWLLTVRQSSLFTTINKVEELCMEEKKILMKDASMYSFTLKQDCWEDRVIKLPEIHAPFRHRNTETAVATAASWNQSGFYWRFPRGGSAVRISDVSPVIIIITRDTTAFAL